MGRNLDKRLVSSRIELAIASSPRVGSASGRPFSWAPGRRQFAKLHRRCPGARGSLVAPRVSPLSRTESYRDRYARVVCHNPDARRDKATTRRRYLYERTTRRRVYARMIYRGAPQGCPERAALSPTIMPIDNAARQARYRRGCFLNLRSPLSKPGSTDSITSARRLELNASSEILTTLP